MFHEGKSKVMVAITLNLSADEVLLLFEDYLKLVNLDRVFNIYQELGDKAHLFYTLFILMKEKGLLSRHILCRFVEQGDKLDRLDEEVLSECEEVGKLQRVKYQLERDIEEAKKELSCYEKEVKDQSN